MDFVVVTKKNGWEICIVILALLTSASWSRIEFIMRKEWCNTRQSDKMFLKKNKQSEEENKEIPM